MSPEIRIDPELLGLRPNVTPQEVAEALKARLSKNGHTPLPGWRWGEDGLFEVNPNGAETLRLKIPIKPIAVLGTQTGKRVLEIQLIIAGAPRQVFLDDSWPGGRTSDATKELSKQGVPLHSKECLFLQRFVAECLRGKFLPEKSAYSHLGWVDNKLLIPNFGDEVFIPLPGGEWLRGYGQRNGDEGEARMAWLSFIDRATEEAPALLCIVGASLSAPLLYFLPKTEFISFMVHIHSPSTGTGKTICLDEARAAWGNPQTLSQPWDSTKVGLETTLGYLRHLPLILNEMGDSKENIPGDLAMMLPEERGRSRGTADGGLRPRSEWRTIAISSGNAPIAPGSAPRARRVLSIPLALPSEDIAEDALRLAQTYFGHPIRWCLPLYSQVKLPHVLDLAQCYSRYYTGDLLPLKPQARLWAVVEIGLRMLLASLGLPEYLAHENIHKVAALSAARKDAEGVNYLSRFIDAMSEDIAGDPLGWGRGEKAGLREGQRPPRGFRGRIIKESEDKVTQIAIMRGPAEDLARKYRIPDLTGVLLEAKNQGVLLPSGENTLSRPVRIGGMVTRCYVFDLAVTATVTKPVTPPALSGCHRENLFCNSVTGVTPEK